VKRAGSIIERSSSATKRAAARAKPALRRRLGERLEAGAAHGLFHDQLALEARSDPLAVARALGDQAKETVEYEHLGAEHRAPLGKLALGVLDVLEGGHHEDRLVVEPRPQTAEHLPGLGRVGGPGDRA